MKKVVITLMAVFFVGLSNMSVTEAAEKNWNLVEAEYTVQSGDTLKSVAEEYMAKNTYGARKVNEFMSGIKELNEWLLNRDIKAGDVLRINYWTKA